MMPLSSSSLVFFIFLQVTLSQVLELPEHELSHVSTSYGDIEGFIHQTSQGIPIHTFLGIRYAQSPDVYNRFKKPEIVEKWAPMTHHAKQFKAACIPYHEKALTPHDNFAEDCLFLNVITPSTTGKDLPVFFFIHGGGFQVGSSAIYGYKKLAETIASQGIVVVTVQYRLGPFGFFSLGDQISPGNLGLWDLTLALHFLHDVLPSFGGDASRITIAGHSAGSAAASALLFSPHSADLISQGFQMSGSSLSEFALSDSVVEESRKLAEVLGCYKKDKTTATLHCMQEKTAQEIIDAVDKIGSTRAHPNILKFHPRLDGEFFTHNVEKLAKVANKKRSVIGLTDQECALFVLYDELSFISGLTIPEPSWHNYTRANLVDFISAVVVTDHEHTEDAAEFRQLLLDFYVTREEKENDAGFYLSRFIELASDLLFLIPAYQEAQIKEANKWPTWFYTIEHVSKTDRRSAYPVQGTYHADELQLFSDFRLFENFEEDDSDWQELGSSFLQSIVNFVKKGDPSVGKLDWSPITKERPFQHMRFTGQPQFVKEPFRANAARLWLKEVQKAVTGEKLRKSRLPGSEAHIVHTEL